MCFFKLFGALRRTIGEETSMVVESGGIFNEDGGWMQWGILLGVADFFHFDDLTIKVFMYFEKKFQALHKSKKGEK